MLQQLISRETLINILVQHALKERDSLLAETPKVVLGVIDCLCNNRLLDRVLCFTVEGNAARQNDVRGAAD